MDNVTYTVVLRHDQWDLIVLAMEHIRGMTMAGESAYGIDKLGRIFLRRHCNEIIAAIQSNYPEAGK